MDKELEAYISGFVSAVNLYKVAVTTNGIYGVEQALDYAVRRMSNDYTLIDLFSVKYDSNDKDSQEFDDANAHPVNKMRSIFLHNESLIEAAKYSESTKDAAVIVLSTCKLLIDTIEANMQDDDIANRWSILH